MNPLYRCIGVNSCLIEWVLWTIYKTSFQPIHLSLAEYMKKNQNMHFYVANTFHLILFRSLEWTMPMEIKTKSHFLGHPVVGVIGELQKRNV